MTLHKVPKPAHNLSSESTTGMDTSETKLVP